MTEVSIMAPSTLFTLLGLLFGAVYVVTGSTECTVEDLDDCTTRLPKSRLGADIIPSFTDEELSQTCDEWSFVDECLTAIEWSCETTNTSSPDVQIQVTQKIAEEKAGYGYVCEANNVEMYREEVRPCLENTDQTVTPAGEACKTSYTDQTWYLDKSDPLNRYKFCTAATVYLACVTEAGDEHCSGDGPPDWIKGFHKGLWGPHLVSIDCQSDGGMEGGAIVITALCAGGTIYCIFFIALGFSKESEKCKSCTNSVLKKKSKGGVYQLQTQHSV